MNNILTVRQRMILGILNSRPESIKGREIAGILGVTDRTVRSDIQILEDFLKEYDVSIEAVRGKGYRLIGKSQILLQQLVYRQNGLLSQDDRIREILWTLLDSLDPIPLGELEDELYVSRSTLEQDLRWISFHYEKDQPHIRILRKNGAISLEADEWKRRYILNLHYIRDWNFNYEAGLQLAELPVEEKEIHMIEEILGQIQQQENIRMSEYDHLSFVFSVAIAMRRIRQGFDISVYPATGTEKTMKAVRELCSRVQEKAHTAFSDSEICALSDEMAHRLQYSEEQLNENYWREHSKSVYAAVITEILTGIDSEIGLSLNQDAVLKSQLLFILLTQYHNPYHSGIRDEGIILHIRSVYPDAMEMAVRFYKPVSRVSGMLLTENYLCEIASYLIAALERQYQKSPERKIKIGMVSHMPSGESGILRAEVDDIFGSQVEIRDPVPVYALTKERMDDCEIVLTTTRLPKLSVRKPILTIAHMMRISDFERLRFLIRLERYRKQYPGKGKRISELITCWKIIPPRQAANREEVLKVFEKEMKEICGESWFRAAREREALATTAVSDGFALLHTWESDAAENTVVCMKLRHPTDWGGIRIGCVIALALRKEDADEMMRTYTCLCHLLRRLAPDKFTDQELTGENLKEWIKNMEWGG